ncbi:MAG: hypothetical protein HYT89_07095 [Candidatus Omnitrophica bacterium]|nr:hypothetical protein [Candidatus Omnitrophota bacterium]
MAIALYLIAVALGYKMLTDALKEKSTVRLVGLILSIFVLVMAMSASLCALTKSMGAGGCPLVGMGKAFCPVTGKSDTQPA